MASAPAPLTSWPVANTSTNTQQNGLASTLACEWSTTGADRRLLFTLTTADSPSADTLTAPPVGQEGQDMAPGISPGEPRQGKLPTTPPTGKAAT